MAGHGATASSGGGWEDRRWGGGWTKCMREILGGGGAGGCHTMFEFFLERGDKAHEGGGQGLPFRFLKGGWMVRDVSLFI